MPRKRHKPEEIVAKLRQVGVLVAQGASMATRSAPSGSRKWLRDELLDGEIFSTFQEAKVIIEGESRNTRLHQRRMAAAIQDPNVGFLPLASAAELARGASDEHNTNPGLQP